MSRLPKAAPSLFFAASLLPIFSSAANAQAPPPATAARPVSNYGKLPLSFEANRGQTDDAVKFIARGSHYNLFLTSSEAVLSLRPAAGPTAAPAADALPPGIAALRHGAPAASLKPRATGLPEVVRLDLLGSNPAAAVTGTDQLPGVVNYMSGSDPSKWHTHVATYGKVRYTGIYPGIDLVYYGNEDGRLEHDFIVAPGVDPAVIGMRFKSAEHVAQTSSGDLHLATANGNLALLSPTVYQTIGGERKTVSARYTLSAGNEVHFGLGAYDKRQPLIIDPVLTVATFVSGSVFDDPEKIAVDAHENAYIAGRTDSVDFPTTNSSYEPVLRGPAPTPYQNYVTFVSKLNATGTALVYSTFLGEGDAYQDVRGLTVGPDGNAYVTGSTQSKHFPAVNAFQPTMSGPDDSYIAELSASGDSLVFSTYFGGSGDDFTNGIALDPQQNIYVAGGTNSTDFPLKNPLQAQNLSQAGHIDSFITKFDPTGKSLVYSTYFGGYGDDYADAIAVDKAGEAYIVGDTSSKHIPLKHALQTVNKGAALKGATGFIAKLTADGDDLVFSTYFGGSGSFGYFTAVALDPDGHPVVVGQTNSVDFPVKKAYQSQVEAGISSAGVVLKMASDGSGLYYSTYLGQSRDQSYASAVAVDQYGQAYIMGFTGAIANHNPFPITSSPFGAPGYVPLDGYVGYIFTLSADGQYIPYYSAYLVGGQYDVGAYFEDLAVDSKLNVYVTGSAGTGWPTTPGAFQSTPTNSNGSNAYVAKLVIASDLDIFFSQPAATTTTTTSPFLYELVVRNHGPDDAANMVIDNPLPANVTFDGTAPEDEQFCTFPAIGSTGTVHCVLPRMNSGQEFDVEYYVATTAPSGTTITNTATVTSNMQDLVPANNTASVSIMVR